MWNFCVLFVLSLEVASSLRLVDLAPVKSSSAIRNIGVCFPLVLHHQINCSMTEAQLRRLDFLVICDLSDLMLPFGVLDRTEFALGVLLLTGLGVRLLS